MPPRLYMLTCGELDITEETLIPTHTQGTRLRIPIPAYVLRLDDWIVLFDTGMTDACYTGNPRALAEEGESDPPWAVPLGGAESSIVGQLARIGLRPQDVSLVVNSHFHFDHCGGNRHFTHCPIFVQRAELEASRAATPDTEEDLGWNAPRLRYQALDGDYTLADGVRLLMTPGHTVGHQSLLLTNLTEGPLLCTFDAVYTRALWDGPEQGAAHDAVAAQASLARLRQVAAETGARVIFGHDAQQQAELRHPPAYHQ
jgi:glyoxylase-like metal-dependent hydrolase (beta-lactamase superfamily II)